MPKRNYSPKQFNSLAEAYNAYQDDRYADTENPTIISRDKFAKIWDWRKSKSKKTGLMAGKKKEGFGSITKEAKSSITRRNIALKEALGD